MMVKWNWRKFRIIFLRKNEHLANVGVFKYHQLKCSQTGLGSKFKVG